MSGRGRSRKTLALIDAAYEILETEQPTTVRAVCYRLFVAGLIDSMSKANTARVSRVLVSAREDGTIPWQWIVDETREAERIASWDSPDDVVRAAVLGYRKDYWRDQPEWVEVWSEKGTVRGSLGPVLDEYGLTFRVLHGFSSATTVNQVAEETLESDKPLTVLYVGDYDPSGLYMSEKDLPERFDRYGGELTIRRVALTAEDTDGLPSFPAKPTDPRHNWFVRHHGHHAWELDAMPSSELRQRVEHAIQRHLDLGPWERARQVEHAEVESMKAVMGEWQRSISRQVSKYLGGAGSAP